MANKLISGFTPPLPVPGLGSHEAPPPVQETVSGPPPMLNEVAKMLFNPASLIPSDFTVPPTEPKESSPPAPPAQPKEVTTEIQEIPASPRVHEEKPQQDEFFKLQQMKYEDLKNHLKNRFGITNVKGTKLDLIQRALKAEEESSAQS